VVQGKPESRLANVAQANTRRLLEWFVGGLVVSDVRLGYEKPPTQRQAALSNHILLAIS